MGLLACRALLCETEGMGSTAARQWWQQATPFGNLTVVVDSGVLQRVTLFGDDLVTEMVGDPRRDRAVSRQFDEYFAGKRRRFDLPFVTAGPRTPLQCTILETLVREVPFGETVSYGELAELSGAPGAARAAGSTMRNNPLMIIVPCHRVVAAGGKLGGFGGRPDLKRRLLAHEGVTIS
jgi:methylated-DNA-[protein]-cysteine S-methyltransferase